MVRLDHVLLVHVNDRLRVVLYLRKERQELGEIHVSPRSSIGGGPEAFGQRLVATFGLLDSFCQLSLAWQRYIVQLFRQARAEQWGVRIEQLMSSLFFTRQGERESGVHPLGALFHCLSRQDALVIFPENGVDASAKPRKQPDRVEADSDKEDNDRQQPEKDAFLHRRIRNFVHHRGEMPVQKAASIPSIPIPCEGFVAIFVMPIANSRIGSKRSPCQFRPEA